AEDGIRDKLVTGVQTCALPVGIIQPSQAGLRRELLCAIRRRQKYAVFRNAEAEISEQRRTEHIVQSADAILVASISDSFAAESIELRASSGFKGAWSVQMIAPVRVMPEIAKLGILNIIHANPR